MKLKSVITFASLAFLVATPALAEGDADKGEKVFKKCKTCHMVGDDAKSRVGPPLNNIVGAKAGAQEGYNYSKAMTEAGAGGLMWDDEKLDAYLTKPKDVVPGGKMAFPGLKKDEDRANVIAYLKKFTQ